MIEDVHPSLPDDAPSTARWADPWTGRPVPGPPAGMFGPVDAPGPESATQPIAPAGGLRLPLPADRSAVAAACEAARHWLTGCGWPAHDTSIACIALGHAVECAVRWADAADGPDGAAPVEVTGTITDRVVDLVVRVDVQLDALPAPGDRTLALLRLLVGDAVLLHDHDGVAVRLRSRPVGCGTPRRDA